MGWRPMLLTAVAWLLGTVLSFVVFYALILLLGYLTNSGAAGICGPFGPAGGMLFIMLIGYLPASILAGWYAGRRARRHYSRQVKTA